MALASGEEIRAKSQTEDLMSTRVLFVESLGRESGAAAFTYTPEE